MTHVQQGQHSAGAGRLATAEVDRRTLVGGLAVAGAGLLAVGLTPATAAAAGAAPTALPSAAPPLLRRGSRGSAVTTLQRDLTNKGYWCGAVDGSFGHLTQQAVWAVQKRNGLVRDAVVGPATRTALANGTRQAPVGGRGNRVEIHLGRQLLLIVRDGRTRWMLNTSTGNDEYYWLNGRRYRATTPKGTFTVFSTYSQGWQWGPLGSLYRPMYFNGGIAVHGSSSIPAWPASHGCCRLSTAAMDMIWSSGALGMRSTVIVA